MARGRMLNRKVATSGKVNAYGAEFGPWALVFHHRLIAFLDKNGNCRADPAWLKAEVFPRDAGVLPEDCRKFAAGLVKHGLAVLYECDGMPYLHAPGFRDEQVGLRPDREAADVPVPQGFNEKSGRLPATFRQPSGYMPDAIPQKRSEVKGREENGSEPSSSTIPVSIDPPTPQDAGIEEDEEEVQAIFEMTEAVAAHVEKAPNEIAARRFMAASDGVTTGLSTASWRDHTGVQVPWRDRPNLLKLALIKCEAEGGWDSNSLHSALKYTILQQRNPTPTPEFARRRERAADPPKRATFEERIAELEKALPYIRRQSLDPFEGGLPSVDVLFIGPEDYGAWDAVLRKHGLKTIAEMREAAA